MLYNFLYCFGGLTALICSKFIIQYNLNNKYYSKKKNIEDFDDNDKIDTCKLKAINVIKNNYKKNIGILAGNIYYADMWTRDAFITSLGLLSIEILNPVFDTFSTLAKYQREDGLIPLRFGNDHYVLRFLFNMNYGKDVPVYLDDKNFSEPTDSNSQFIILAYLIYKKTNDSMILFNNIKKLKKAFYYMIQNTKKGLLNGTYFDSWHDTFTISGPTLFTNALYVHSIYCMMKIIEVTNSSIHIDNDFYFGKLDNFFYLKSKKNFKEKFWNGKFLKIHPNINVMETAGNSFAILFNLISSEKSRLIIDYIENNKNCKLTPNVIPQLPSKYIYKPLYLVNIQDYHNELCWLWVNNIYSAAKKKVTFKEDLYEIEKNVIEYDVFFETLTKDIKPTRHYFQSSEVNFSESAGSYLFSKNSNETLDKFFI